MLEWTGMGWTTGMACKVQIPVVVFFHTLSNRVEHTAMKMHGKIVLESMDQEGSCVRTVHAR